MKNIKKLGLFCFSFLMAAGLLLALMKIPSAMAQHTEGNTEALELNPQSILILVQPENYHILLRMAREQGWIRIPPAAYTLEINRNNPPRPELLPSPNPPDAYILPPGTLIQPGFIDNP